MKYPHLLIKYIKSVLWRVAKCLSYIEETRCLKVNTASGIPTLCKWPSSVQVEQLLELHTGRSVTVTIPDAELIQ